MFNCRFQPGERSPVSKTLGYDPWSYEDQEKPPVKGRADWHILADQGGAGYGDNALGNMAITGRVEGDAVGRDKYVIETRIQQGTVFDYKAKMEFDAALRLRKALLDVKNAIGFARNTGTGADFQFKQNKIDDSMSVFYTELHDAEIYLGEGGVGDFETVRSLCSKAETIYPPLQPAVNSTERLGSGRD
jgi:hypothetical protein